MLKKHQEFDNLEYKQVSSNKIHLVHNQNNSYFFRNWLTNMSEETEKIKSKNISN